jgi:SulP family sulfate permease
VAVLTAPFATALRAALKTPSARNLRDDALAGLIVSLLALPLSMALSIAVGLPPRHGLYTAVVAGVVAALCGGSPTQVSGPTAAFVVIVAPVVAQFGLSGIIWCEIMAGAVLIALGLARAGRFIRHVPFPVVTGFTAGIAVTIGTLALNDFFGLRLAKLPDGFSGKAALILQNLPHTHGPDLAVGAVTLLAMIFLPKLSPKIPAVAAGIALGALAAWALARAGLPADTLSMRYAAEDISGAPRFAWPGALSLEQFRALFPHALIIAALAALESLLSATVADSLAGTKHDPDAELTGIGIANIFSGLSSGIPATGAIARTAANIHAGAKTPFAALIHALLILLYMLTLAKLIGHIPMAALAALLLMTAWRMSHAKQVAGILRLGASADAAVLLATLLLTVFVDMVAGVGAGLALAVILRTRAREDR